MDDHPRPNYRRRKKLIRPKLQLRLTAKFTGVVILTILLQTILASTMLARFASALPSGGGDFYAHLSEIVLQILMVSFVLIVPLTVLVGILATFRIAGPVYRFITFLDQVSEGTQVDACVLRDGDELKELCEAINRATEPLRHRASIDDEGRSEGDSEATAA